MFFLQYLFRIISTILELYSLLCIARIIITWIPEISYSKPFQILSKICDPYLNLFRGLKWMRIGSIDFSPVVSLCLLEAVSSIFSRLARCQTFSITFIISLIITMAWTIVQTIISFFFLLFLVRLVFRFIEKSRGSKSSYILESIDYSITPLLYSICKPFFHHKKPSYEAALIFGMVYCLILSVAGSILVSFLTSF